MKTNELRIGNYINIDLPISNEGKLTRIGVITSKKVNGVEITKYKPIPLTEEWLLKLGLSKIGVEYCRYYKLMYFGIKIKNNEFIYNPMNINMIKVLKYVHELQNLFHALTGEELTQQPN